MRLADDRRARVPFALVGVLLLVGASSVAVTMRTSGPASEDHSTGVSVERTAASVRTALRDAATTAAREAAANPVTIPANTTAGSALNRSAPFRDALRLRIYLAAREALRTARHRRADVTVAASLPPANETSLARAKRRVRLASVDDGTAMQVTVRNVSIVARRDGRIVASRQASPTVTVASPVLAAHRRAQAFERRLNRDAVAGPGLGRRLTAWLYAVAWARGYAQYGGLPVSNVLANRHVELGTNRGVLEVQQATFGHRDPSGERAARRAGVRVGLRDLVATLPDAHRSWTAYVLPEPRAVPAATSDGRPPRVARSRPGSNVTPGRSFTVGVNHSADVALARLRAGTGGPSLERVERLAYRSSIRVLTTRTTLGAESRPDPDPPDDEWEHESDTVTRSVEVSEASGPTPSVGRNARAFRRFSREVTVERTLTRRWSKGNQSTRTSASWTTTHRVGVTVAGAYRPRGGAPNRTTDPLFRTGGPLRGPNLADVRERTDFVLDERGGPAGIAKRAVLGDPERDPLVVHGRRPDALADWVYRDLADLRERVRNVTVTVTGGRVASGRANVARALAARVRDRRAALVDAPETYDGAADRARVAVRAAYIDRLLAALDRRAARTRETNERFAGSLDGTGTSPGRIADLLAVVDEVNESVEPTDAGGDVGGDAALVAEAAPTYLTQTHVRGGRLPTVPSDRRYHPLVARNTNLFTVPYGDAADRIAGGLLGPPRTVSLRTAGQALRAANRTAESVTDPALDRRRAALSRSVADGLAPLERQTAAAVDRETPLGPRESREAVRTALRAWDGHGARVEAAADGRLASRVVSTVADRTALSTVDRDRLGLAVRVAAGRAMRDEATRVPQRLTNRTVARVRRLARRALTGGLKQVGKNATERVGRRVGGGVPAGLPVAPVPGYWYATVNVWTVSVKGEFARFGVRTDRGAPGRSLRYVRDGSVVRLDVDGDGRAERLGQNERVSFAVHTTVAVAVPPTGRGVGDVDGNADERSPGWSTPGCDRRPGRACRVDRRFRPGANGTFPGGHNGTARADRNGTARTDRNGTARADRNGTA